MICSLRQKEALLRSVVSACDPPGSVALAVQRGLRKYDRQTVGMFEGLAEAMVDADGLKLFVRHGGAGPAVLLLHRYPRTSATWHRVAPQLATLGLTVSAPIFPGTAAPGSRHRLPTMPRTPNEPGPGTWLPPCARSDTTGSRSSAMTAGATTPSDWLDHPQRVSRIALWDCLPISEHLDRADARFASLRS